MGVQSLGEIIKRHFPTRDKSELRGKTVVVDLQFYIHSWYALGFQGSCAQQFAYHMLKWHDLGARPVYILDGPPPAIKRDRSKQLRARKDYRHRHCDRRLIRQLCEAFNVPLIESGGEAEAVAADMVKHGYAHCVDTGDTDAFVFGAPRIHYGGNYYALRDCLRAMSMTYVQFVHLCMLLGNEYNARVQGPAKAVQTVRNKGARNAIVEKIGKDHYDTVYKYFTNACQYMNYQCNHRPRYPSTGPNHAMIKRIMRREGITETRISNIIARL